MIGCSFDFANRLYPLMVQIPDTHYTVKSDGKKDRNKWMLFKISSYSLIKNVNPNPYEHEHSPEGHRQPYESHQRCGHVVELSGRAS
jgi:hypothetical protein